MVGFPVRNGQEIVPESEAEAATSDVVVVVEEETLAEALISHSVAIYV